MSPLAWLTLHCEGIGYIATSLFTVSFIVKSEKKLLGFQLLAASLWCFYGVLIAATPVIVANILVAGGATFKLTRLSMAKKTATGSPPA